MSAHADLPFRLTTTEVCALARVSRRTFAKRRQQGRIQLEPCERGHENLWKRDEVLRALGMIHDNDDQPPAEQAPSWDNPDANAIREARSRQVRQRSRPQGGRDVSGAVRGSAKTPALRLAFDASAPD